MAGDEQKLNPDLDRLMVAPYPELASALLNRKEPILQRWRDAVTKELPHADGLTLSQVNDDIPLLLGWMASALRSPDTGPLQELMAKSPKHGETRFHQDFNLNELIVEYHLLRRVILEEVEVALSRSLKSDENVALNLGVDISLRIAAVEFAQHQATQLKAGAESQAKYLSFLSHDLRGGLNGVLLMIEVLRRDLESSGQFEQSLEDLDMMKRTILDTVGTMERFLHAERLRKGLFVLRPSRVNLWQFIADVSQVFVYHAKEKGLQLIQEVPRDTATTTDREVLAMIMQNLLSNAIKYSQKGTVRIGLRGGEPKGESPLTLFVQDQGPGIPKDKLDQLFAPFVRGQTHGQKGTGLGLAIAREGADLLGAKLWAESEVGKGTTFFVQLP